MKMKEKLLIKCKILTLAAGMAIVFMSSVLAYDLSEYYPLSQGDSWTYSVFGDVENHVETITIDGKEKVGEVETIKIIDLRGEYGCVAVDSEGVKEYKHFDVFGVDVYEYMIYTPPRLIFPDTAIGKAREYAINFISYGVSRDRKEEHSGSETGYIRIDSLEDVEVAAGRFNDCLRFTSNYEKKEFDGGYEKGNCAIWLARGIGKVKEYCVYVEYDVETRKLSVSTETLQLISAVVDGEKIGGQ